MTKYLMAAAALAALPAFYALAAGNTERASAFNATTTGNTAIAPVVFGTTTSSFLRLPNASGAPSDFKIKVVGNPSGTEYTTSAHTITVPNHASPQKSITEIRTEIMAAGKGDIALRGTDTSLTLYAQNDKAGTKVGFQLVIFDSNTGFFENTSVCTYDAALELDEFFLNQALFNVHTTALAAYPSTIFITNPDEIPRMVKGNVFDGATGAALGSFTVTVGANATGNFSVASLQTQLTTQPAGVHVNIEFESADTWGYTAIPAHRVRQTSSGAEFNLTTACPLNPPPPTPQTPPANPSGGSTPTPTNPSG